MFRRLPDRLIVAVVVAVGLTFALSLLARWTPYGDLRNWTYDFLVNHGRYASTSPDIVFIDFDDATFAKIQKYPIPRSTVAAVIDRAGQAKPAVIGLDMFLSEARSPDEDAAMQRALTAAGNVVIGAQAATGQLPAVLPLQEFCQPENVALATGFCAEGKPGAFAYAAVNMPYDSDGYVRDAELVAWGKQKAESFPVFLAEEYLGQVDPQCSNCTLRKLNRRNAQFRGHRVPFDDAAAGTFRIGDWSPRPAQHLSAWDVLSGAVDPSRLRDKLVLIGQSSDAARDQDFTPLFRVRQKDGKRERLGGTELHAAAIATLLDGHAIGEVPVGLQWTINLIVLAGATWTFMRVRLRNAFVLVAVFVVSIYAAAQILFTGFHLWYPLLETLLGIAAALPCGVAWQYVKVNLLRSETEQQRVQLMELFSRYVDPQVAHTIWLRRDEVSLEGDERMATVLFSDIRNFTGITAGKPSKTVLRWLNRYFTAMDEVIRANGGFLNKFIGDGLLVVYGVPLSQSESTDAGNAVRTALAMLERVQAMNASHPEDDDWPTLRIGVGIHTGMLTSGSVGSVERLEYSVIGETVNLASRLESLNKEFGTEIILSEGTYQRVKDQMPGIYPLGATPVRGFGEEITIYGIGPRKRRQSAGAEADQPEVLA
ncbi:MAG TPA: adenylate/guanylate cyclase domain-containing protein [Acidobacteriaceae bacterium]|jgi:adenylate cyclase|nr:adenylate/guanylate cyclase domain-containing protein [Acidobacteriaceae bacterium]